MSEHNVEKAGRCTCANDGSAVRCPHHSEADFQAAVRSASSTPDPLPEATRVLAQHYGLTPAEVATRLSPGPWPAWGDESRFPPEERS